MITTLRVVLCPEMALHTIAWYPASSFYDYDLRWMDNVGEGLFHEGRWYAFSRFGSGFQDPYMIHTTTPMDKGSWQLVGFQYAATGATDFYRAVRSGSQWAVCGDYGALYYSTDPTSSWTKNQGVEDLFYDVGADNWRALYALETDGTTWVVAGELGLIATGPSPSGTFTMNTSPGWGTDTVRDIIYGNGVWLAVVGSYYELDPNAPTLWTTSDPTGSWTQNTSHGLGDGGLRRPLYYSGKWYISGDHQLVASTSDPSGAWTVNQKAIVFSRDTAYGRIARGGDLWVVWASDPSSDYDDDCVVTNDPEGEWFLSGRIESWAPMIPDDKGETWVVLPVADDTGQMPIVGVASLTVGPTADIDMSGWDGDWSELNDEVGGEVSAALTRFPLDAVIKAPRFTIDAVIT